MNFEILTIKSFYQVSKMKIYIINNFEIRKLVFNIGRKKIRKFPQLKFASKIRFKGPLNRDGFFILIQQGQISY